MTDKPRIMVVDDSEASRHTLTGVFTEVGCEVFCEESGEGAWMVLNAGKAVDLIVLDWHMPMGMSGPAFNRKIKGDERFKEIPVVAFSSKWDPQKRDTPEANEWLASFADGGEHHEVAKAGGESDARRVPVELLLNVAAGLEESGKTLPAPFAAAVASLKERG